MPRPSQEPTILAAALACFADIGYDATRVRHIAERAGVSEGALYRHYRSKEALAQALFEQYLGAYSALLAAIAAAPEPLKLRLERVVAASLGYYRQNPAATNFVLLRQPSFICELPAGFAYPLELIEGLIREGQAEGLIRDGATNLLAAIFLGCILRPLIVAQLAEPGALDLLHATQHDAVIAEAAWAALARPEASRIAPTEVGG
jgi:AcrR family transcriptional regulator